MQDYLEEKQKLAKKQSAIQYNIVILKESFVP
jgi:hypothetical protein